MGLAEDKEGLRYEGNFTAGKRNGLYTVKDSSGNVIRTCEYIMGQIKPEKPIEEPKKKTTTKSKKRRREKCKREGINNTKLENEKRG